MLEMSLHILDLAQNAAAAQAENLMICVERRDGQLRIVLEDDGCGMDRETLEACMDPFRTSRKTRRVGLGLPLMRACARRCGGDMRVTSEKGRGTRVEAFMRYDAIDCPPMGDLTGVIQAAAAMDSPCLTFRYTGEHGCAALDMKEVKKALGGVPVTHPEVFRWIGDYLNEGFSRADGAEALNAGEIYFGGAFTMKSVAELEAIRLATLEQVNLRREHEDASHVVIGMGTCGIAAGAKNILKAFMAEANAKELLHMTIAQTGCMGNCELEPIVEVSCPGQDKVIYTNVTTEMVGRIVAEHIVGGKPVEDYIAK